MNSDDGGTSSDLSGLAKAGRGVLIESNAAEEK
jgi:hypothetical protein